VDFFGLYATSRFLTSREIIGRTRTQLGTLITSSVLTGRSNEQESCYQAVVHAQWSAMDRNSIIAPFLLYHRRKRRRNRLHWVHPIIQKGAFYTLLHTIWWTTSWRIQFFLIIFECLFYLSTRSIAAWRRVFSVVTVKWGTTFNL